MDGGDREGLSVEKNRPALFGAVGILFLVVLGLVLYVAGVFGSSSSNGDNANSNSSNNSNGSGSSSGGSSGAANGLRLLGADPITLDPALATDADSAAFIVEIFSGLVTLDKSLKVVPDLAESWDISPDGKVYTFHIRKDAQFQDGTARPGRRLQVLDGASGRPQHGLDDGRGLSWRHRRRQGHDPGPRDFDFRHPGRSTPARCRSQSTRRSRTSWRS